MEIRKPALVTLFLTFLLAGNAWGGAPIVVNGLFIGAPTVVGGTMTFPAQPVHTGSAPQTETLTVHMTANDGVNSIPVPGYYYTRFIGATINNPDFAVTGGSCVPNLDIADGGNCTLQLTFTPSAAGSRNGILSVQCMVFAAVGIVTLACDNVSHEFMLLAGVGNAIASVAAAIPALGPGPLTALALLLFGASILVMHRRR